MGRAHDAEDGFLAACTLGRQQSRIENQEPEFTAPQPAKQERRQGKHCGAIQGERPVRGDRTLFRGLPWRRNPLPQTSGGFSRQRRRAGDTPERSPVVQRLATGPCGKDQRTRPPLQCRSAPVRSGQGTGLVSRVVAHPGPAALSADSHALRNDPGTARHHRALGRFQWMRRRQHPRGSRIAGIL